MFSLGFSLSPQVELVEEMAITSYKRACFEVK
jgi:hypothetical protein